jgi:hypothetical protein
VLGYLAALMKAPAKFFSPSEVQEAARQHRGILLFVLWYVLAVIASCGAVIFLASQSGPLTAETQAFLILSTMGLFLLAHFCFLVALSVKSYRLLKRVGASAPLLHLVVLWVFLPVGIAIIHHFTREGLKRQGCQLGFVFAKGI